MQTIEFVKMTGAGNDFVLIDNRHGRYSYDWSSLSPVVCNRRYGVGADGLLVIEPSIKALFKMNYYNADGSFGGMCGNGGRCSAFYIMEQMKYREVDFEALDYVYHASKATGDERLQLWMKDPHGIQLHKEINIFNEMLITHSINTGSPHVILFMDELPLAVQGKILNDGIHELGKSIRNHVSFSPDGTNVNFVTLSGQNVIEMRTYERGVEDETLACGTGSIAAAAITSIVKGYNNPMTVRTRSNELLRVSFDKEGERLTNVILEGSAKKVFSGILEYPSEINEKNLAI